MCPSLLWINILAVQFVHLLCPDKTLDQNTVFTDINDPDDVVCLADCGVPDYPEHSVPEVPKIPKATNGEDFPWDDVR